VRPSAGVHADGPSGHREDNLHREDGYGSVMAMLHPPIKGAYTALPSPQFNSVHNQIPSHGTRGGYSANEFSSMGKLPKLNFALFDGDNPKHRLTHAEDYFELYDVEPAKWVKLAAMHFTPTAARWLPSVEKKLKVCSWAEFRQLLRDRFG
jgi:hypothetical protein